MRFVMLALAALFFAGPAMAKEIKHTEAGVIYSLPDAWKVEMQGPMVSTIAPDESLFGLFMGVEQANLEAWLDGLGTMLDGMDIKNFTAEEPKEGEINGMPAVLIAGKGMSEGKSIEIGITIVVPPGSAKALVLLGINEVGADKKYASDLEKVFKSLKPLK